MTKSGLILKQENWTLLLYRYDEDQKINKYIHKFFFLSDPNLMFHLQFEEMMDRLEKNSGQTVVTLNEAKSLLKQDNDYIIAVYDYWLNKRLKMASFSLCLLFLRMPFY